MKICKLLFLFLFLGNLCACRPSQEEKQNKPSNSPASQTSSFPYAPLDFEGISWTPWGNEVFEKAEKEKKNICLYLYQPYFAWCHSFEQQYLSNSEVAYYLSQNYVLTRANCLLFPELESAYARAGLPALVFLTPQNKYFALFYGLQSSERLKEFLLKIQQMAQNPEVFKSRLEMIQKEREAKTKKYFSARLSLKEINAALNKEFLQRLQEDFDPYFGGFGKGSKIFHLPVYEVLLRLYLRNRSPRLLEMVQKTFTQIQISEMYDRMEGGFHRVASGRAWDQPFFEKTLTTNGEILQALALLEMVQKDSIYARWGEETFSFLQKRLKAKHGYFAGLNCGVEDNDIGKTYIWSSKDIDALMPPAMSQIIQLHFGLDSYQNPQQTPKALSIQKYPEEIAKFLEIPEKDVFSQVEKGVEILLQARKKRKSPSPIPWKTLDSQALLASAFFASYRAWGKEEYLKEGENILPLFISCQKEKGIANDQGTYLLSHQTSICQAFLDGYNLTGKKEYLEQARKILQSILSYGRGDPKYGGFVYGWGKEGKAFHALKRVDFYENLKTAYTLLLFYHCSQEKIYQSEAEKLLSLLGGFYTELGQFGSFFSLSVDLYIHKPIEILVEEKNLIPTLLRRANQTPLPVVLRVLSPVEMLERLRASYNAKNIAYVVYGSEIFPMVSEDDFLPFWRKWKN